MASDSPSSETPDVPDDAPAKPASEFGDILFGLGFILFAVLMFVGALHFPYRAKMGLVTSSAFTPILLSALVVILSLVLIVVTCRKPRGTAARDWLAALVGSDLARRAGLIVAMTAVYVLAIGEIHFLAANFLYLLAMFWYLRIGTPVRVVLFAAANALLVSLLIPYIFQLPLP